MIKWSGDGRSSQCRRLCATRSAAAGVTLLLTVSVVCSTSAQTIPAHLRVGGGWHFVLTIGSAKSSWDATIKQGARGNLKGRAEPSEIDCRANVSGTVKGATVRMTWQVLSPCAREIISFKGSARRNRMSGSFVDSKLGKGAFKGKRDE